MSRETSEWLNQNVLVGFTEKRGHAWHYRASDQGTEPNHYPNAIPVEDVERRLFDYQAVERPVFVADASGLPILQRDRKAIVHSKTGDVFGLFKDGYQPHQPKEWLLDNVGVLLGDDVSIGSAGVLAGGARAWVQVEVPETIQTPEGLDFRPNLLAATSFDGTLSTTYKRTVTVVVCDNTCEWALSEKGQQVKVKHSRRSLSRLADAREALAIIEVTAEEFADTVHNLANWDVSTREWDLLLDAVLPVQEGSAKSATIVANKKDALTSLYQSDSRVSPWNGTALGVVQAFNTYGLHESSFKGGNRVERNGNLILSGKQAQSDADVLKALADISGGRVLTGVGA